MNMHSRIPRFRTATTKGLVAGDPAADIRLGLIVAGALVIVFLVWGTFARLDAASYARGTLGPSGQRQTVQHKEGGIVGAVLVREGEHVARRQLLLRLAAADTQAQNDVLKSQAMQLLAQRARLRAEQIGAAQVDQPLEFKDFGPEDREELQMAMRLQSGELAARRATMATQMAITDRRAAQSVQQSLGFRDQVLSANTQIDLLDKELQAIRPLAQKGFVSQTRIRQLERTRAELVGQRGQYTASVAQSGEAASESRLSRIEIERQFRERTAAELQEVESKLTDVLPKLRAARDQLARTQIRAPAAGTIVGLSVFTPGAVITPGQRIMDIVPDRAQLVARVRISPDDADDVAVGQVTRVRFGGLHERTLPSLDGVVTQLSADNFTDEKSGQSYYTAEVRIAPSEVAKIRAVRGEGFALRAGMPVEVLIPLKARSALDYLLEPLTGAFWSSLNEH